PDRAHAARAADRSLSPSSQYGSSLGARKVRRCRGQRFIEPSPLAGEGSSTFQHNAWVRGPTPHPASASAPERANGAIELRLSNISCTRPAIRSLIAGAPPL